MWWINSCYPESFWSLWLKARWGSRIYSFFQVRPNPKCFENVFASEMGNGILGRSMSGSTPGKTFVQHSPQFNFQLKIDLIWRFHQHQGNATNSRPGSQSPQSILDPSLIVPICISLSLPLLFWLFQMWRGLVWEWVLIWGIQCCQYKFNLEWLSYRIPSLAFSGTWKSALMVSVSLVLTLALKRSMSSCTNPKN